MNRPLVHAAVLFVFLVTSCAMFKSSPPSAPSTPEPPQAEPASVEAPAPSTTAAAAQADAPDAQAQSPAAEEPKPKTATSGRPLAVYEGQSGPTTVAIDGAAFRVEGAELRIPAGALREARNIVFTVDKKSKGTAGKVGAVFLVDVQMPERQYVLGQDTQSRTESSRSTPFLIKLPLPSGATSGNLAVESVTNDEKTKKPRSTWAVYPMSKLESSDAGSRAVFELPLLPDGHVHITTSPPSQAPEP